MEAPQIRTRTLSPPRAPSTSDVHADKHLCDLRRFRPHEVVVPAPRAPAAAAFKRRLEVADDDRDGLVSRMVRPGRDDHNGDLLMPENDNDPIAALDAANKAMMSAALLIQDSRATIERFLNDIRKLETAREEEVPPALLDKGNREFLGIIRPVYDHALKFLGTWERAGEEFKAHEARRTLDA